MERGADWMRTLVIGDIHGELAMVQALVKKVKYDSSQDELIFLGDYIDRGPDSKGVIAFMKQLQQAGAICLSGNHEQIMYEAFKNRSTESWLHWLHTAGGAATLKSYGFDTEDIEHSMSPESFVTAEIEEDLEWIRSLETYVERDDYIFVHGGVDPEVPLSITPKHRLLWIRQEFHDNYRGKKTVVFGHTPTPRLHKERGNFAVYFGDNNIIGLDGGAVFGGALHCLVLPTREIVSINAKG